MTPDDDIYDLDVDLDTEEDDDADTLMREAVAAVEALQENDLDIEVEVLSSEESAADSGEPGNGKKKSRPSKPTAALPFSGMRTPEEVRVLEEEVIALRERCLRALADLENYRRRTERERNEMERFAGFDLIREFLGVVDNLERALGSKGSFEDLSQGVEMIHRQLLDGLKRFGVERVESIGSAFDPAIHEAVARVEDVGVEEPTVLNEMQSGFLMHDRLLRPAIVQVAMPVTVVEVAPETADGTGPESEDSAAALSQEAAPSEAAAPGDESEVVEQAPKSESKPLEQKSDIADNQGPVVVDDPGIEIGGED